MFTLSCLGTIFHFKSPPPPTPRSTPYDLTKLRDIFSHVLIPVDKAASELVNSFRQIQAQGQIIHLNLEPDIFLSFWVRATNIFVYKKCSQHQSKLNCLSLFRIFAHGAKKRPESKQTHIFNTKLEIEIHINIATLKPILIIFLFTNMDANVHKINF